MANKITDINDLVILLTTTSMRPLMDDDLWRLYGYKTRPKSGSFFHKLFPKKFELEDFITREVLIMGLIDAFNAIKKSKISSPKKLLLSLGVVDQFTSITKQMFDTDLFMEDLFSSYASYRMCDHSQLSEPIVSKSIGLLHSRNFAKFMVGTVHLLSEATDKDYLLKSSELAEIIDTSVLDNKLNITMSEKTYTRLGDLIQKNILTD